jgi:long-subunit acyl-CoA synthetase (AMP-forming)
MSTLDVPEPLRGLPAHRPEAWEPGGDELTPTMRLERRPIAERHAAEIESLSA